MNKMWGTTLIIATLSVTPWAAAQSRRWTHFGLRPLGMGNAYVAVADDFNALYYNPAGLARIKSWDGELINLSPTLSAKSLDLYKDVKDLDSTGINNTIDLIEQYTGENQYLSLGLSPHLIFPNFGFGFSTQFELSMVFHREISVDLKAGLDVIMPIAFAMNFFQEKLSVGLGLKVRTITGVDQEFSMEDIDSFNESDQLENYAKSGMGYGADIGLLFTPTPIMEPTIGLSITDLGGVAFSEFDIGTEKKLGIPAVQLPSVNLGLSLKPIQGQGRYVLVAIDMHSINQPYSFSKKLQLGSEFGWGQFLKAQLGLYQGYPTAGLQLDAGIVNLRLLTYAEELGEVAGTKASRRYAFQIKLLL